MCDDRSLFNIPDNTHHTDARKRRRFGTSSLGAGMAALLSATAIVGITMLSGPALGQPPPAAPGPNAPPRVSLEEIGKTLPPMGPVQQLADNLYLIPGQGCNTAVWVHSHGVLIVDTKFPGNGSKLLELIRTITDKPVTHIVNTHVHGDHTGSNSELLASVEIVAQENTALRMQGMQRFKSEAGRIGLPDRTFKQRLTLFAGKDTVELYYFGPAHTDGDIWVVFPHAGVAHSGDVPKKKEYPTVERGGGGSGVRFFDALTTAIATVKGVNRVIGGHSDKLLTWNDLLDITELSRLLLEHETAAYRAGKSAEQTWAEFEPPARFHDFSKAGSAFGGVDAVRATFQELAESGKR